MSFRRLLFGDPPTRTKPAEYVQTEPLVSPRARDYMIGMIEQKTRELDEAFDCARVVQKRIDSLFDAIAHGDEEHRAWLRKAIEDHFAGRPVQMSQVAPGTSDQDAD